MGRLNYHHLRYFLAVAKEGSIARASEQLHLAHPTISAQIHQLEEALGEKLFSRRGRNLVLTDFGHVAMRYAEEIFSLGREFLETAKGRPTGRPIRLVVGISNGLPKSIVYRILAPALRLKDPVQIIGREDRSTESFMGELAMHQVDVVVADGPAASGSSVRAFSHPLGECGTAFFAAPALARQCRRRFPQSLDGVPFLLPGANSALRHALTDWFGSRSIRPLVIAELDDPALAKIMGEGEHGVFAAPDVVEKEILQRYQVQVVGRTKELRQRFFAISLERKIRHPAVVAISEAARDDIFA